MKDKMKDKINSMNKINKVGILVQIYAYLFPLFIVINHLFKHTPFFREYWIIYLIGFVALIYAQLTYCSSEDKKIDKLIQKVYFIHIYFLLLYIYPIHYKYNIWQEDGRIFKFTPEFSTCIVVLIIAYIAYVVVFSDFRISEISFGNAKISILEEKDKQINKQFEYTNQLVEKIKNERLLIENMREYCIEILEKTNTEIDVHQEYQFLINKYFENQKENIKVYILGKITEDELYDFHFKRGEITSIKYSLEEHNQLYSTESNGHYYVFIPFYYLFEDKKGITTYIVLESKSHISVEIENNIIHNILIKFTDDFMYAYKEKETGFPSFFIEKNLQE